MLCRRSFWAFLFLALLSQRVSEAPLHCELWFDKNPNEIHVQWGREILKWKRDGIYGNGRSPLPKIMMHEFTTQNGGQRKVFIFPELGLVDVGAMPAREWPLVQSWIQKNGVRRLIWRKSDRHFKEWQRFEERLPPWIEKIWWVAKTGPQLKLQWRNKTTRRLWSTGSRFHLRRVLSSSANSSITLAP